MKIILISMPDVVPIIIHETAVHMPNHGIACVGGNIDADHEVYLIDLIRKRRSIKKYLTKVVNRIQPDLIGLSAMAWQYDTCIKIAHLLKELRPQVKIALGGYHATLMAEEIADAAESRSIDFIIRGEGEECCRRLVNALAGRDRIADIPSLSYKQDDQFIHNPRGENLDLSTLKLPIRDQRRLTWGYHIIYSKIELLETSRGCTRSCNFCSMKHMYGRTFRTYPISRVLADLDDIYYQRKTRWVFITDDNMVLNPARVMEMCDAIIARNYQGLNLVVQADCISMASNEPMVAKMAQAGFRSVFLGIENGSQKNLKAAGKGDIVAASKKAIENCHKYGMMVIGGLIFGFPEDDADSIRENYEFFVSIGADASYCQTLTPYPKTGMREQLLEQGLIVNQTDYKKYSGLWANIRTHHLSAEDLQYQFWLQRQLVLGWWNPPDPARRQGRLWTSIWRFIFKPYLKMHYWRIMRKGGWEGRYQREVQRWERINTFTDLEGY
ncbi:MAG: B12-binding domain-containing radical SAM protein [Desulfobulbus sp.]|nr:B12-binding domain-containing radical SAM protein [Desulfobulbus sp.]